jgi:hypothetical protein
MDPNGPAPAAQALARRLMEHEANGRTAAEDLAAAGERVLLRLRQDLARVLGTSGFSTLEARALDLARRRYAFLGTDGGSPHFLDDTRAALAGRDADAARDALQAVCGHLIGLLVTFLGEPLTTQFIRLAWPDLPGEAADRDERETR